MKKVLVALTLFAALNSLGCSNSLPEPKPSDPAAWTSPTDGSEPELVEEGP